MKEIFTDQEKVQILADLVAKYLQRLFAKYGITAKLLPLAANRADLVAEIGSGAPVLGVSGHMDMVTSLRSRNGMVTFTAAGQPI